MNGAELEKVQDYFKENFSLSLTDPQTEDLNKFMLLLTIDNSIRELFTEVDELLDILEGEDDEEERKDTVNTIRSYTEDYMKYFL